MLTMPLVIERQNKVIKMLSFRKWRKRNWVKQDYKLFNEQKVRENRNLIEYCLVRFRKACPQANFDSFEVRQNVINAISKESLNYIDIFNAIDQALKNK
jgi:hypothetical protein